MQKNLRKIPNCTHCVESPGRCLILARQTLKRPNPPQLRKDTFNNSVIKRGSNFILKVRGVMYDVLRASSSMCVLCVWGPHPHAYIYAHAHAAVSVPIKPCFLDKVSHPSRHSWASTWTHPAPLTSSSSVSFHLNCSHGEAENCGGGNQATRLQSATVREKHTGLWGS